MKEGNRRITFDAPEKWRNVFAAAAKLKGLTLMKYVDCLMVEREELIDALCAMVDQHLRDSDETDSKLTHMIGGEAALAVLERLGLTSTEDGRLGIRKEGLKR